MWSAIRELVVWLITVVVCLAVAVVTAAIVFVAGLYLFLWWAELVHLAGTTVRRVGGMPP